MAYSPSGKGDRRERLEALADGLSRIYSADPNGIPSDLVAAILRLIERDSRAPAGAARAELGSNDNGEGRPSAS